MRKLSLTTAQDRYDRGLKVGETSWEKLVKRLTSFTITDETFAEYQAAGNEKLAIKDVGWFVGGPFEPAKRRKACLQHRSILTLDLDHLDPWDVDLVLDAFKAYEYVLHSSHSHSEDEPRLRLIMPFARDVTVEEYEPIGRQLANFRPGSMDYFDDTGFQVSRIMFWPSRSKDGEEFVRHNRGSWVDPDDVLSRYDDWEDWGQWPTSSREQITREPGKRAEDPYTKPGVIGAFNRVFEVPHAIEEFGLPYELSGQGDDRYSYQGGSSVDGAIYYADDGHLYSWHESDPARGNHNAWDLVRVHKFGDLDDDNDDTPIGRRESQKQMAAFAATIPEVASELAASEGFQDLTVGGDAGDAPAQAPEKDGSPGDLREGAGASDAEVPADPDTGGDGGDQTRRSKLTYDAIRARIDSRGSPIDDRARREIIVQIAAARLEPSEISILAALIKAGHQDPAPTKQAILDEIKATTKRLTAQVAQDGEIRDIEEDLIQAVLDEHYAGGEHLRRFGRGWWFYDAGQWRTIDEEAVIGSVAVTFMRLRKTRPDDVLELVAAVGESQTSALTMRLSKMMSTLVAERYSDPDPLGLMKARDAIINCRNGELHFMRDGSYEFTPHHPELFLTSQVPVDWDPQAECPEWDRFCQIIFADSFEPDQLQRHLEELGGYLIQYTRWLKTWVLFHGPTNAGKTTIGKVFENLLGRASANRPMGQYDGRNAHAEAGLVGKLMLLDEDFAKGSVLPDGFIKKISEAKTITANPKNRDEFDFVCRALPIVVANHWPPTRDVSDAFRERALVFDFTRGIPAEERDDERARVMLEDELPGILRRFVEGFARLRERGSWDVPADCVDARSAWEETADSVRQWVSECTGRKPGAFLKRSALHGEYVSWYRSANPGARALGSREFGGRLGAIWGPPRKRTGHWGWPDLEIQAQESDDFD